MWHIPEMAHLKLSALKAKTGGQIVTLWNSAIGIKRKKPTSLRARIRVLRLFGSRYRRP